MTQVENFLLKILEKVVIKYSNCHIPTPQHLINYSHLSNVHCRLRRLAFQIYILNFQFPILEIVSLYVMCVSNFQWIKKVFSSIWEFICFDKICCNVGKSQTMTIRTRCGYLYFYKRGVSIVDSLY